MKLGWNNSQILDASYVTWILVGNPSASTLQPCLAPSKFFLVPNFKNSSKGIQHSSIKDVRNGAFKWFNSQGPSYMQMVLKAGTNDYKSVLTQEGHMLKNKHHNLNSFYYFFIFHELFEAPSYIYLIFPVKKFQIGKTN